MKFLHTADLHIGKVVNDFSMLEEQAFALEQIKEIAIERKVDGVLLAGDIYDRAIPAGDAVLLLDTFLTNLMMAKIPVYLISGNHDSAERISFGEAVFKAQGIGIGGVYKERTSVFTKEDEWGTVEIVLLPFLKPAQVDARTSQEAVDKMLHSYWETQTGEEAERKGQKRRILMTHYFVTDEGREPELSDSETTIHVGGLDQVDASVFKGFDYVALGHIHKSQQIGDKPIYYAGAPLKYSFGEVNQTKSVLLIELGKEGLKSVEKCPIRPIHEMRKVKGELTKILENAKGEGTAKEDYIQAILTDPDELIDPIGTLRSVYPNIMQIVKEEKGKDITWQKSSLVVGKKEPLALFEEFYRLVREEQLPEEEKKIIADVIKQLSE